jgi:hypothetical protein
LLAIRIAAAFALVFAAVSHGSLTSPDPDRTDLAAYALPDGSLPVLCLGGQPGDEDTSGDANPCELCRLSGAAVVPEPDDCTDHRFRLASNTTRPPGGQFQIIASVFVASNPSRGPPRA